MSHLQEAVHTYDVPTMIQFNRTMIMLGLCAFRAGLVAEAHQCLTEICSLNKTRELLGQVRTPPPVWVGGAVTRAT
jgi:translation initiation factor 3 subunit C